MDQKCDYISLAFAAICFLLMLSLIHNAIGEVRQELFKIGLYLKTCPQR